jgi:hypothetical protein
MAIPASFQARLDVYCVDETFLAARKDVWTLLEPRFEAIFEDFRQYVIDSLPAVAERWRSLPPQYGPQLKEYVGKLFCEPFDERWVEAVYDRMRLEVGIGQGMRTRPIQMRAILSRFSAIVGRQRRFSGPAAARLIETAMRVFMIDVASAIAAHEEHQITGSKARQQELEIAIGQFEASVGSVRNTVTSAVSSLNQTSGELADLAKDAATQARTATASAGAAADEVV